jgi:hypothetical protein
MGGPITNYESPAGSSQNVNVVNSTPIEINNFPGVVNPGIEYLSQFGFANDFNANLNFSGGGVGTQDWLFIPQVRTLVKSFAVTMLGGGNFNWAEYGNTNAVGSVDLEFIVDGASITPMLGTVTTNYDWFRSSTVYVDLPTGAEDAIKIVFDFSYLKDGGFFLETGGIDRISVTLASDMSSLTDQTFCVYTGVE